MRYPNGLLTPPRVSSPYGPRTGGAYSFHYGTDYVGFDVVHAIASGTVVYAGYLNGSAGYTIRIKHGAGIDSRYMHNAENLVEVGAFVAEGEAIAIAGKTGNATGICCHLEIFEHGKHVNPAAWLNSHVAYPIDSEDNDMIVNIQGRAGVRNGGAFYIANGVATFLGGMVECVPTLDFDAGSKLAKRVSGIQ